jgi:sporulation protein YlmC with PRC-barrel domain
MRHLLLASVAMLTLAAPALADSLQTGAGVGLDATVDTGVSANAEGVAPETPAAEATTLPDVAGNAAAEASSTVQGTAGAARLIGLDVVDANGESVGEVTNAVLAGNSRAVSQVVIRSGGLFGFGGREVAVDAADVDTSTAGEGTVKLHNLTAADLESMADFKADQSVRLLNPS